MLAGMSLVGAAYAATAVTGASPSWAPWCVAFGGATASVALFVLGAATRGTLGPGTAWLLVALFVVIAGAFGAALAIGAPAGPEPVTFGLPRRLAIVFYGVGFAPLLVLPFAFARTFGRGDRG